MITKLAMAVAVLLSVIVAPVGVVSLLDRLEGEDSGLSSIVAAEAASVKNVGAILMAEGTNTSASASASSSTRIVKGKEADCVAHAESSAEAMADGVTDSDHDEDSARGQNGCEASAKANATVKPALPTEN